MYIQDKDHLLYKTSCFKIMLRSSVYTDYTIGILRDMISSKIDGFDVISDSMEPSHILIKPNDESLNIGEDTKRNIYNAIRSSLFEFFKNTIVQSKILAWIEINKKKSANSAAHMKEILDRIIFNNDNTVISLLTNIVDIDNMIELILL